MVFRQVYLPKDIHGNLSPNQSRLSLNCCYRQSLKASQNQQNIATPIYKAANIHSHVGFPDILSARWVVHVRWLSELDHRPVSDLRPAPTISGSAVVSSQCLGQDCYLNSYTVWLPLLAAAVAIAVVLLLLLLLLLLMVLLFLLLLMVHPNEPTSNKRSTRFAVSKWHSCWKTSRFQLVGSGAGVPDDGVPTVRQRLSYGK